MSAGLRLAGFRPRTEPIYRVGDRVHYVDDDGQDHGDDTGTIVEISPDCADVAVRFENDADDEYGGVFGHERCDLKHCPWQGWRPRPGVSRRELEARAALRGLPIPGERILDFLSMMGAWEDRAPGAPSKQGTP